MLGRLLLVVVVVLVPGIYAHVVGEKGDEKWTDMGNEEREEWKIVGKEENGIKWTDMVKEEAKIGRWLTSCNSPDALKVRLSLKSALGDEAYAWNENELYLFKAAVAYAVRQHRLSGGGQQVAFTAANVETCNVTERVSFYFRVTDPSAAAGTVIPKADVEEAVRQSRGRINSAFLLSDDTLEFVGLPSTLAPPVEPPVEVWLVAFGVVMSLVVVLGVYLIVSGFLNRKRKSKEGEHDEEEPGDKRSGRGSVSDSDSESQREGETNLGFQEEEDDGKKTQF
ncbi:collectrin-like [Engraulis encrasicolus]|uniref:collectrin-like n=1 Tax=Engraulis encrasicolus TaxID=184585 RepID=UPI002FD1D557